MPRGLHQSPFAADTPWQRRQSCYRIQAAKTHGEICGSERSTSGARRWESRRSGTSRRQRSAQPWLARLALDVRTLSPVISGARRRGILAIVLPSSFAASGSILGHAIVWHRPRNDIGEPEDLADGKPVFGGSAHRPPPQRAEPGQCAGVNWLGR
jgi:hypothetical protein